MARFTRLEVLNTIIDTGLVPVFYNNSAEVTKNVARAISAGGCRLLEFTNVAGTLHRRCSRSCRTTASRSFLA